MSKYKIQQKGKRWYVLRKWWLPLPFSPRSLFMAGSGPFDEGPISFLSKEIAEEAIKKYPNGKLVIDFPGIPVEDPIFTMAGQKAMLQEAIRE